jgi:hypothetical protein
MPANDDSDRMKRFSTEMQPSAGISRRRLLLGGMLGLAGWVLAPMGMADAALQEDLDLVSLIPGMAGRDGPLLVFQDFRNDPDVEIEHHIHRQLVQRKELLPQLKEKIGFEKQVTLAVEDLQVRLMFVPQGLNGNTEAYQRYCTDVTDFVFASARVDNFYATITSPRQSDPPIAKSGISAFLVHRLAKAYRAVCRFSAESGRQVRYHVNGAIFSSHLGAVDLDIQWQPSGQCDFQRKPFTIWQNDTENLYTLLSVPVEETLHYVVGKATDREIASIFREDPPQTAHAAKVMAQEWMAVEESMVGGLVDRILSNYCRRHRLVLPACAEAETIPAVPSLPQYRYRRRGLRLVRDLGLETAMTMYLDSPAEYRRQLLRQQDV